MKNIADATTLHNGVKMPWLGLGVWRVSEGSEIETAIHSAINAGYRSLDTAAVYRNEGGVGKAISASGLQREELFLTTKVWNSDQGYESTLAAFDTSLSKLGVDYVDLYLIHWPVQGKYKETWKALERLYLDGRVRAIGVSNFHIHHLQNLMSGAQIKPMVNQVEYHPLLIQDELLTFCKSENIQFEAWSPLAQGQLLSHPTLSKIAEKYDKSIAQVILRWDLQNGVVTIPKSITPSRIAENGGIFDFELSAEDMAEIQALNENRRVGPDPDNFDF